MPNVMGNADGRLHFDGDARGLEIVNSGKRARPCRNCARETDFGSQELQYSKLAQQARLLLPLQAPSARPEADLPSF